MEKYAKTQASTFRSTVHSRFYLTLECPKDFVGYSIPLSNWLWN